ncbi:GlsB/YeaQ/YmgE family stress response membrane protein [Streptomyces iconiensis]|uniref:GlsB/YeaQ/YmgE family stress response membrane protein n=1 Tax=Streptomyces iconiensis TaxID=1384038 RepID=A0ABT7A009_9ACTN|nr:GlsB/YeaQ/YmgE family stress response membrane protein [Streptomyces iconiensis]MDJ1134379.1 GlsB/YeaQ/YmgE family stress response membrane protein [Streptomyces iconiensis]
MLLSGILSALVVGAVIGTLGRLVVPGRQHIGILVTFLIGLTAALLGAALARGIGITTTTASGWAQIAVQTALAGLGIAAADRIRTRVGPTTHE